MKSSKKTKTPKIDQFFKTAPKSFSVEPNIDIIDESPKQFYVDILKNTLEGLVHDEEETIVIEKSRAGNDIGIKEGGVDRTYAEIPAKEIATSYEITERNTNVSAEPEKIVNAELCRECDSKTEQIKYLEVKYTEDIQLRDIKYKDLQKRFLKLNVEYGDLSLKYKDLLKVGHRTGQSDLEDEDEVEQDDIFSVDELKTLKSLPLNKRSDSTFILQCLKFAYKSDLSILCGKSLNGTLDSVLIFENGAQQEIPSKCPLTPEKVSRIRQLFVERLSECKVDAVTYGERIKDSNVNHLLASGLNNITKKYKGSLL